MLPNTGLRCIKMKILISDPTLRDGSHAIKHQINTNHIKMYCQIAEKAGIPIVEVGHGNGLGASSLQLGESLTSDEKMVKEARKYLKKSKLGIHIIPGYATIEKDLKPAIDNGVDVVRVASHCTEADLCEKHVIYARNRGVSVWGCLMMAHMIDEELLLEQIKKFQEYGAEGVVIMDSSGNFLPDDVSRVVGYLVDNSKINIGFHGHNNLGVAISNSISAINAGAHLIDATSSGFGAGAGNTQLEVLVAVLNRLEIQTDIDLYSVLDLADLVNTMWESQLPRITSVSVISGLSGVFSGFIKPVKRIAKEYKIDPRDLFIELGNNKIIAGQEDKIIELAAKIKNEK